MRRKSVVNHFDRLCVPLAGNPRESWRAVRPFMHAKLNAPEQCITMKNQQTVIRDQNHVAETVNGYFTNITKNLKLDEHLSFRTQSHFPKIHRANGASPRMNIFNLHLTNFGVEGEIPKKIKPNKAQGCDLILPIVAKVSSQTIARPLSNLINTVVTRSEVPDTWKDGQITPHHKKDSVLDKANYRPVTVVPVFGKVFEVKLLTSYRMTLFLKSWNFMDLVLNQSHFCAAICHLDINGLNSEILSQAGWVYLQGYHKEAYLD